MNPIVKIKPTDPHFTLPTYATPGSVGMDLYSCQDCYLEPGDRAKISCGFTIEIPPGYEGQVRPRSGMGWVRGITIVNTPGTIDSDYRGELMVVLINHSQERQHICIYDRIAQLVIAPICRAEIQSTDSLSATDRDQGGFGSTGR
jgi:dUTP pyrophosphatase